MFTRNAINCAAPTNPAWRSIARELELPEPGVDIAGFLVGDFGSPVAAAGVALNRAARAEIDPSCSPIVGPNWLAVALFIEAAYT